MVLPSGSDMASLWTIRQQPRRVRVNGREYRYPARMFYRLAYRLWFPSGRVVTKTKDVKTRSGAAVLLRDAEKLEARSQRAIMDQTDVRMFHAIGLLTDAEAEQFLGRPPNLTWEKLLQKYEKYSATHCRPNTHRENMRRVRQLVVHLTGREIAPEVVTTEDAEDWKAERKRAGVSNRTVNIELNILWQLLDGAFEDGHNPARSVEKLDVAKMARLPRALTPDEDEAAMGLMWDNRRFLAGQLWRMYLLYRFGGLRRDEARLLPWAHVLEDRVLVQQVKLDERELSRIDKFDQNTWRPKEGDARAVPLPKWVMEDLRAMPRTSRLVFSEHGRAFFPSTITRAFKRILKKVAPELTLHDLRHTYITEQMENGVPPARVQRLAGHKLLSTTERYTHVAIEARVRNLERAYRSIPDREALVREVSTGCPPTT